LLEDSFHSSSHLTKPSYCFAVSFFFLFSWMTWTFNWSGSEYLTKLYWSAAVMISYNRIALVGLKKLSFLPITASHDNIVGDGHVWKISVV